MYVPEPFRKDDRETALALIADEPFGMLVSVVDGEPFVTHLPFCILQTEPQVVLGGHVAKANPHWKSLEGTSALAVFRGPHGYVSPRWHTSQTRNVPTWNYAVVHCGATATIASEEEKMVILSTLVGEMEAGAAQPWSLDQLDADYRDALRTRIVAFHLRVHTIQTTFKFNQNDTDEDRAGILRALAMSERDADRSLGAAMKAVLKTR